MNDDQGVDRVNSRVAMATLAVVVVLGVLVLGQTVLTSGDHELVRNVVGTIKDVVLVAIGAVAMAATNRRTGPPTPDPQTERWVGSTEQSPPPPLP